MQYKLKKSFAKPYLYCKNNLIYGVNKEFENLTGFSENDIIGQSINEAAKTLRIDSQISICNIEGSRSCYLFTKGQKPREVTIKCTCISGENEKKYFITEKPGARIESRLQWALMLFSNNKVGGAIYSVPEGVLLNSNDTFLEFIGREGNKPENLFGITLEQLFPNYKGSSLEKLFVKVVKNGVPYFSSESRYASAPKQDIYWDLSLIPIIVSGKVKYIVHTTCDMTEVVINRKLVEDKNKEMQAVIDNMSEGLFVIDKNSNITLMNDSMKRNLYAPEKTKKIHDTLNHMQYYNQDGELLQLEDFPAVRILKGEKFVNWRYKAQSPQGINYYSLNGSPIFDNAGNIEKAFVCIRDITEIVKSQQAIALKNQYEILNNIVENLCLSCMKYSYPDFEIIYTNNVAFNNARKINKSIDSIDSILGKEIFELLKYTPDETNMIKNKLKEIVNKKSGSCTFIKNHIIADKVKYFKIIFQPLFDLNYDVKEVISIAMDITEEVQAKNKMEDTLKAQDDIFANVAHELKTPLNVIYSSNQLIELYLKNGLSPYNKEKILKGTSIIKQNCYRFTKLINNIVDLSKMDSGFFKLNLCNENIVEIVEEIVQSVSEYIKRKGVDIIFDTNKEECITAVDASKIERVILNLISNAVKFTNAGGSILVTVFDKGHTVEIIIKDTGTGINEENLHNIFDRFYQEDKSLSRNTEGSGIGLSLVKSIVDLHKGKVSVNSKVGQGSTFKIELPVKLVKEKNETGKILPMNNKIEMINIEFSDIYGG